MIVMIVVAVAGDLTIIQADYRLETKFGCALS